MQVKEYYMTKIFEGLAIIKMEFTYQQAQVEAFEEAAKYFQMVPQMPYFQASFVFKNSTDFVKMNLILSSFILQKNEAMIMKNFDSRNGEAYYFP